MQINHLEIKAFAGLKNYEVSFRPGLNCIYGPNERGKTTVMQFIFAMFYGLGDRRAKDNLRDRVSPRDGSNMSGTIWFEHADKNYELNRSFGERSGLDQVVLIDLSSNQEIELDHPDQPGVDIFELPAEVFLNTVMINYTGPKINQDSDVSEQIWAGLLNFMVNADNNVSAGLIGKRLEEQKLALRSKSGHKGEIPLLEQELEKCQQAGNIRAQKLKEQAADLDKLNELEFDLTELKKEQEKLELQQRLVNFTKDRETLTLLNNPEKTLQTSKAERAALLQNFEKFGSDSEEIAQTIDKLTYELDETRHTEEVLAAEFREFGLRQEENSKSYAQANRHNIIIFFAAIILIVLSFSFLNQQTALIITLFIVAFWFIYTVSFKQKQTKASEHLQAEVNELERKKTTWQQSLNQLKLELAKVGIELKDKDPESFQNLNKIINISQSGTADYADAKAKLKVFAEQKQDLDFINMRIAKLETEIKNSSYSADDRKVLAQRLQDEELQLRNLGFNVDELEFSYEDVENLRIELAASEKRINEKTMLANNLKAELSYLLRNPETLEAESLQEQDFSISRKIAALTEELAEKQKEYEAIVVAEEVLQESLLEFRQELLPKLNQNAGRYMQIISRDNYDQVLISDDLNLQLRDNVNSKVLAPDKFSSGTSDQLWFSYRLALTDYLANGSNLPLLLDDSFVNFDDRRIKASLGLLEDWSGQGKRQILLFTCHKHIAKLAENTEYWEVNTLAKE